MHRARERLAPFGQRDQERIVAGVFRDLGDTFDEVDDLGVIAALLSLDKFDRLGIDGQEPIDVG